MQGFRIYSNGKRVSKLELTFPQAKQMARKLHARDPNANLVVKDPNGHEVITYKETT